MLMLANTDFKIHFVMSFSVNSGKIKLLAPDHSHSDGPLVSGSQKKMNGHEHGREVCGEEFVGETRVVGRGERVDVKRVYCVLV